MVVCNPCEFFLPQSALRKKHKVHKVEYIENRIDKHSLYPFVVKFLSRVFSFKDRMFT